MIGVSKDIDTRIGDIVIGAEHFRASNNWVSLVAQTGKIRDFNFDFSRGKTNRLFLISKFNNNCSLTYEQIWNQQDRQTRMGTIINSYPSSSIPALSEPISYTLSRLTLKYEN